jgi:hypothetical protein
MKYRFKNTNAYFLNSINNIERGSFGKTGPPGKPGKDGPEGDLGPPGVAVSSTLVGVRGPSGEDGYSGPRGLKGPPGIQGDIGDYACQAGPAGMPGTVGDKGPPGIIGEKGEQGNSGDQGKKGKKGLPGKGKQGPQGDHGVSTGPKGFGGARGRRGKLGEDGLKGKKGPIGPKGKPGRPGLPGVGMINLMNMPPCKDGPGKCVSGIGIDILSAHWGGNVGANPDPRWKGFIEKECKGKTECNFKIDYGTLQIPNPKVGEEKDFKVEYICDGKDDDKLVETIAAEAANKNIKLSCPSPLIPTLMETSTDRCDKKITSPEACRQAVNSLQPVIAKMSPTTYGYVEDYNFAGFPDNSAKSVALAKQIATLAGYDISGCGCTRNNNGEKSGCACDPFAGNWSSPGGLYHYPPEHNSYAWWSNPGLDENDKVTGKPLAWWTTRGQNWQDINGELPNADYPNLARISMSELKGNYDNGGEHNIKCWNNGTSEGEDDIKKACTEDANCKGYTLSHVNKETGKKCRLVDFDYDWPNCEDDDPSCITEGRYQIKGKIYKREGKCYHTKSPCWGCLNMLWERDYPDHLEEVPCEADDPKTDCKWVPKCTKNNIDKLEFSVDTTFKKKDPNMTHDFAIKEDLGFEENSEALPHGCSLYLDPVSNEYNRVIYNSANSDTEMDNNENEKNPLEEGEWQNRSSNRRLCLYNPDEKPGVFVLKSGLEVLSWQNRYDMANELKKRLPTINEVFINKEKWKKDGVFWMAIGTPLQRGWIQIGINDEHEYGKLLMTSTCKGKIYKVERSSHPDIQTIFTEKIDNHFGTFEDACRNKVGTSIITDLDKECINWLWEDVGCNAQYKAPKLNLGSEGKTIDEVKAMISTETNTNETGSWLDSDNKYKDTSTGYIKKCNRYDSRYEGEFCHVKGGDKYPTWGDQTSKLGFKTYQYFVSIGKNNYGEFVNKSARHLPNALSMTNDERCNTIRFSTLLEAKEACDKNPFCYNIIEGTPLCGKKYELKGEGLFDDDGFKVYQKFDIDCHKEYPYRTVLTDHEAVNYKYCYNKNKCIYDFSRTEADQQGLCGRITWKERPVKPEVLGTTFTKEKEKGYYQPFAGDRDCKNNDDDGSCFTVNNLQECKDKCINDCISISYDDSRKYCQLNENTDIFKKHGSWETYNLPIRNVNKKLKTWTIPGHLFDSGWIEFKALNGAKSFYEIDHGLLDFGNKDTTPVPRIPDLCRVYVKIASGVEYNNEGLVFEAGGMNASDNDVGKYGNLTYIFNENNIRIIAPDKGWDGLKNGSILMTENWGNMKPDEVGKVLIRIVAY